MTAVIRILIVEDQENDYVLAKREIKQVIEQCEFIRVETYQDFVAALQNFKPDLIVSDFTMPHFDGLSVIKYTLQNAPLVPVIIYTGTLDEETAAETVKAGAVDYVLKDSVNRLKQATLQALEKKQLWQDRMLAEEKLKASEERYRLISAVTSDYMFSTLVNPDDTLELDWVAGAFETITGYTLEEYKSRGGWRASLHPDYVAKDDKDYLNLKKNHPVITEIQIVKKNGKTLWVKIYAHPVWDDKRNCLIGIYGAVQNINERKQAEEATYKLNLELESLVKKRTAELENTNADLKKEMAIRASAEDIIKHQLQEKEILLKEIHHRVKNNMQVIISMLNLQASFVKNKKVVGILQDSQSRIKTMALIHEKLYQSIDLASIDLTEYLKNLCAYLFTSYVSPDTLVKYSIDAEKHAVLIDTTISIGLITNELITNSFKYACIDNKECVIKIVFKKFDEENFLFSISDNGKGLPKNFDYRNSKGLGLQLVCMLTDQINGKLEVTSSNTATTFTIIFPAK